MIDIDEVQKRLDNISKNPDDIINEGDSIAVIIVRKFFDQINKLKKEGLSLSKIHSVVAPELNVKTFSGAYYRHQKKVKMEERKKKSLETKENNNKPKRTGNSIINSHINKTSPSIKPALSSPAGVVDQDLSNI